MSAWFLRRHVLGTHERVQVFAGKDEAQRQLVGELILTRAESVEFGSLLMHGAGAVPDSTVENEAAGDPIDYDDDSEAEDAINASEGPVID